MHTGIPSASLTGTLDSQRTRTVLGRRAFRVCGPATWNALPTELRAANVCPDTFGKKTELELELELEC